jgi:hypothetical protein
MASQIAIIHIALFLALLSPARVYSATNDDVLAACSAFGPDGMSAAVTVGKTDIALELATLDGKTSNIALPLRYSFTPTSPITIQAIRRQFRCEVYFDRSNTYAAVGINSVSGQPQAAHLQVGVANLKAVKWIGDWVLDPEPGFLSPSLAGFLEGASSLIVLAPENNVRAGQTGAITIQLFSPTGALLDSKLAHSNQAQTTNAFRYYADTMHNRLWFFSCSSTLWPHPQPLCPVSVSNLVGEQRNTSQLQLSDYRGKRDDLWEQPGTFAAINADTVLVAETVFGKDTIWRVNIPTQSIDRFVVHRHFLKYNALADSTLSPDAEVYAVLLEQLGNTFPYLMDNYVFRGTDVILMQTHPFRLLLKIPHADSSFTAGLAVDHRDGKTNVLVYRRGHWEHHALVDKPLQSHGE